MGDLIEAAKRRDFARVRELVERGADINDRDGIGNPALSYAVIYGGAEVVAWFLATGADPNVRSATGYTPLIIAAGYGCADIVRRLRYKGPVFRISGATGEGTAALCQAVMRELE